MRKFLIASHGTLASGIKSSVNIIIGETEHVFLIEAYVDENKTIEDELMAVLSRVAADDELIIFTDLLGGSITNQVARLARRENVHLVSGFNLPLLVEILLSDADTPAIEVITTAVKNAREQIVYVNEIMNLNTSSND